MGRKRRYFLFVLYGVLLTAVLLYVRFPSDTVRGYFQAEANKANPRLQVSLGHVRPSLAPGLAFEQATVFMRDEPDRPILTMHDLVVKPSLLTFIRGNRKYDFDCTSGNGEIAGWVELFENGSTSSMNASAEIRRVPLQNVMDVHAFVGRAVEGVLGGTVSYSGKTDMLMAGAGQADLRISDGKLLLSQPILGLDAVRFDELLIQLAFKNMNVNLTRVELFGEQLQGTLSGNISLRRDISLSRLNLRGTVEPFASLFDGSEGTNENFMILRQRLNQGRLSFVITGTLTEPKIRFI